MLFSSITFLYYFLPIVIILYLIVPFRFKNLILLTSSLIFYAWGEPKYVFLMMMSIILGYIYGLCIERTRGTHQSLLWMIISCLTSLGLLCYFKYYDFVILNINTLLDTNLTLQNIILPIGISFFTFQILSYTIDVYKGRVKAQRNLISFGAYVSMFPQLIAGPIVRYVDVSKELEKREINHYKIYRGLRRFIMGLSKKVLIANTLGELTQIMRGTDAPSVLFYWMYAIAFTLHIYFDFSGYSDMAIGLGEVFGFYFPENFRYPYVSKSITEFWRRWHISLGTWFRDYVYIPLGGNRVDAPRFILNIMIVWMLTGLWHGAAWNFIIWGLLFGVILLIEKFGFNKVLERLPALFRHLYVLFIVIISFVIFNADTLNQAVNDLISLLGLTSIPLTSVTSLYYLRSYAIIFIIAAIGALPFMKNFYKKLEGTRTIQVLEPLVLIILLFIVTSYLVDGSYNPFLYFRF